ncbi:MAG: helix-turn-helix transcriptional regulator [Oscillospiraceae bacterium]|nr:helix-turn-helix transcriptional regulator [Oscillospiraceae bacterium]
MDAIRQKRKEKKLTLRQLAKMVGCSESAISQYENGKRCPDYEMLLKIAEALDSSVSFLLTGVEDTAPVHFSRDEEELLHHYLSLTPERKTMVLEFARFLNRPE